MIQFCHSLYWNTSYMTAHDRSESDSAMLIAFCGVDGAGKTSLLEAVEKRLPQGEVRSIRSDYELIYLVENYCRRSSMTGKDWLNGAFAETVALGGCFDFLSYYDKKILPLLETNRFVLADRYELCYRAYLDSTNSGFDPTALFWKIRNPDLTIFVDAPSSLLETRYAGRGGASEAETISMADEFRKSYKKLLEFYPTKYVCIMNDRSFDEALTSVWSAISNAIADKEQQLSLGAKNR